MKYRHEWKHEISYGDMLALRQRLRAVAQADPHAEDGKYLLSLYFTEICSTQRAEGSILSAILRPSR